MAFRVLAGAENGSLWDHVHDTDSRLAVNWGEFGMPYKVVFSLYIVVRKLPPTTIIPIILHGKRTGRKGFAAFEDYKHALSMADGWEPDAEVSEMNKPNFARLVTYFSKTLGITHVALNAGTDEDEKNAGWIPIGVFDP